MKARLFIALGILGLLIISSGIVRAEGPVVRIEVKDIKYDSGRIIVSEPIRELVAIKDGHQIIELYREKKYVEIRIVRCKVHHKLYIPDLSVWRKFVKILEKHGDEIGACSSGSTRIIYQVWVF